MALTNGFTAVARDRTPITTYGSKKIALLAVVNNLFKIYFKVNTLPLCSKLINIVEGPSGVMSHLKMFPLSDVVSYKFYIGRLKMFEDHYEEARDALRFALRYTPLRCFKNRQRILTSLIPVEMCLGILPSEKNTTTYGLYQYGELARAVSLGNIKLFEDIMQENQRSLIRLGVYLVLEQVKIIAYRNLFKRVHLLTYNTRLRLPIFLNIFQALGENMDIDEIECIIANLIHQGKIKGYISHEKSTLIIAKSDPFPNSAVIKKYNYNSF
jgi:hypothetical protein